MNRSRRRWLAAGCVAAATGSLSALRRDAVAAEDSPPPRTKAEVPTPALLLDLDRFEANLRRMADHCRQSGRALRPHAKTHKCPEIARRQLAAGAVGICVATVAEAEALAAAGIDPLLLTSPIVEPAKVARVVRLRERGTSLMLAIGDPWEADLVADAAAAAGQTLDVLLDVDVGDHRTGVGSVEAAVELARRIASRPSLRLRGLQGYAGLASHVVGFADRAKSSRTAWAEALRVHERLVRDGFELPIVSGGSTGTYNIDSGLEGPTELQAGSYVFMDVDYRRIGGHGNTVYDDFAPSLTALATVVAAPRAGRVTLDAGTKSLDTTTPYLPEVVGRPDLTYARGGDEFGYLSPSGGGPLPQVGDRLELIVPHCDPTVHLHDRLYAVRGERVEDIWPIVARRETAAGFAG